MQVGCLRLWMSLLVLSLSSCMVGPNFRTPPSPCIKKLTKQLPRHTVKTPNVGKAGRMQTFIANEIITKDWWRLFHSKELNELIDLGISRNRDLAAAYAALRAAREAVNVAVGALFPAVNLGLTGSRSRAPSLTGMSPSTILNVFNTNVSATYLLDLFGGTRRQIESLRAEVDYQQFQLIAIYNTLTANIVTTAITIASLDAQIAATHELLNAERGQLDILRKQFELGGIAMDAVLTQETLVNQTLATLPPLEKSLSQQQHALSVLTGSLPEASLPRFQLDDVNLPQALPVSLPSHIVRQRPDIRAAESLLHAANANIGVATANLLPQITLNGSYGWQASTPGQLFKPATKVWTYGGSILQPLFHGGSLLAARRQAIALRDEAYAHYQQVVLQAFQNVTDTLRALEIDARLLRDNKLAEVSAEKNLKLVQEQFKLGGSTSLALLIAQQKYQTQRIFVIQSKALRYIDTATLFYALGGGWWHQRWCVKECV